MNKKQNTRSDSAQRYLFDVTESTNINDGQYAVDFENVTKLKEYLGEARNSIDGFPISEDESILDLSLPPFYAACPSPFLMSLIDVDGQGGQQIENIPPLTKDVVAGKNDPLYFAHYYSTKVPPDAIVPYILHYTKPGDVIFDGFCGTGMTGVAAQLCEDIHRDLYKTGKPGRRKAILIDLSPTATFIAAGTNALNDIISHLSDIEEIVRDIENENAEILSTRHVGWPRGMMELKKRINAERVHGPEYGKIEYIVWSDVFSCFECGSEIIYWDLVFEGPGKPIPKTKYCNACGSEQSINTLERIWTAIFDHEIGQSIRQAKQVPVLINYRIGTKRYEKHPDKYDLDCMHKLVNEPLKYQPPIIQLPKGFNTQQPLKSHGFSHVHHFFTRRNLSLFTELWSRINEIKNPLKRMAGLYLITGMVQRICRLNRYMPNHDRHVGPLSGTLYVSQLTAEIPATNYAISRVKDLRRCGSTPTTGNGIRISTQSSTCLKNIDDDSIDYIFTDPPFGGNLNYSELNILVEAWIGVQENNEQEAVVNNIRSKTLTDYSKLMECSFVEFYRILKPCKWMTVEFHNSQNSIWTSIQEALTKAGFVIADVRTLDKKKGTTKQLSYGSAVKQDLVITAYKPNGGLEERFKLEAGSEDGVWDFVRTHLKQLPVFVSTNGQAEVIAERQHYLLFDRMVAFHVQRGVTVPMSAAEFYAGLEQRFPPRDGMYFLPDQAAEYDKKRMTVKEVLQLQLFVSDEASAIQWLKQLLTKKPQTFQDIHPQFLKKIGGWQKHETALELSELLEQNFLRYDSKDDVPSQIHSYLSSNFKELRNLEKDAPALKAKAKDRWYVPDPNKAGDLEKLRERTLMREFQEYRESKQKRLKVFRLEAVRAGFKKAWQERDYATIITMARKIPDKILQEDPKLLMWYDQAVTRSGEE